MAFSFGFSGDDITDDAPSSPPPKPSAAATPTAFPVPGKPQLPPTHHPLSALLAQLPSKIAYGTLDVTLGDGSVIRLPRRELWDVRVQLMAEEEELHGQAEESGLGNHDVKTGVYEGGFKSWESSVDLVNVLAASDPVSVLSRTSIRFLELGCGTALPSLALFQWAMSTSSRKPLSFILTDYNPSVLQLVTLPNFLLAWALAHPETPALKDAFSIEDELELGPEVLDAFQAYLRESDITLSFVSGAWSPEFVDLIYTLPRGEDHSNTVLMGAETIYSPFALQAFTETMFLVLEREREAVGSEASAYVAAKRLYFGVGGSLDDFIDKAQEKGAVVTQLSEVTEGVRRGVVQCVLSTT